MTTKRIFVTATNTDVGKTFISEKLVNLFSDMGLRVSYLKPIETGVSQFPLDGKKVFDVAKERNPELERFSLTEIVPYQFRLPASPFVAKGETEIKLSKIVESLEKLEKVSDIVIIEGAGGTAVPISENYFTTDLIADLGAKAVLVAPTNLGSISDTLLSIWKLESEKIDFIWTLNLWKDKNSFDEVSLPFYKSHFKEVDIFQKNPQKLAEKILNLF
ncbi:dethiobiotin synthase [Thiovulum sp. ES]|nr:dethiobiotin synthase [Thiovulum sp. ES]